MKTMNKKQAILGFCCMVLSVGALRAHTSYGGTARDLGPVVGGVSGAITGTSVDSPYFKTINTGQTVSSNFGWGAGTDADLLGDAHHIKAYRFTLGEAAWVSLEVSRAARGTGVQEFLPGFSLYSGLLHTSGGSDYDTAAITLDYLATLGGTQPKRGAFYALGDWKMGNDAGTTFADLSALSYLGNGVDGSAVNYGPAAGIQGDGLLDGRARGSFWLAAGDYSVMVGGAGSGANDIIGSYGIDVSLTVIPEPSVSLLGCLAALGCCLRRRRA
jgi:hypothetical protein